MNPVIIERPKARLRFEVADCPDDKPQSYHRIVAQTATEKLAQWLVTAIVTDAAQTEANTAKGGTHAR